MVFFTCNHCGESVKKPAVEKHYNTKCRGATVNVSCMDCLKDFHGEEYVAHTKCISELQKYSGKDYVHKEARNSGAKKQESWMDIIRAILDSSEYKMSEQARSAFQRLQSVDNVPRKKAKFQNFVKNCMHMPMRLAEEVWSVLEKEQEKMKLAKQQENAAANAAKAEVSSKQNGVKREATETNENEEPAKKKSKKNKSEENEKLVDHVNAADDSEEPKKKKSKKQKAAESEPAILAETNGDIVSDKKKAKKQKHAVETVEVESHDTTIEPNAENTADFEWAAILKKIVKKNVEGITLEKLKKRVLKKYAAKIGVDDLTEKQVKKFEKKFGKNLKKSTAVQVVGELVTAC